MSKRVPSHKGKVAVVTGASSGFGVAIAEYLAREGVKVGLLARRIERLRALEEKIKSNGGEALAVLCDVTKKHMVFEAVEVVRKELGSIDILINNAGMASHTYLSSLKEERWIQDVDVNVIGPLHCLAACLPDMLEKKRGHIIGMSSMALRDVASFTSVYAASKNFMQGHCVAMRKELVPLGIKVTIIQPGLADTEMVSWLDEEGIADNINIRKLRESLKTEKILTSDDVAEAVMYALNQPAHAAVNEVLLEPTAMPFSST